MYKEDMKGVISFYMGMTSRQQESFIQLLSVLHEELSKDEESALKQAPKSTKKRAKRKAVRKANSHMRWSKLDLMKLVKMKDEGKSVSNIMKELKRTRKSVNTQLWLIKKGRRKVMLE